MNKNYFLQILETGIHFIGHWNRFQLLFFRDTNNAVVAFVLQLWWGPCCSLLRHWNKNEWAVMILHQAVPRNLTEDLTRPFAPFTERLRSQVIDKQDIHYSYILEQLVYLIIVVAIVVK
jgi:hypothetical protein